jgi:N-acyl homoserine lactone hydrolase
VTGYALDLLVRGVPLRSPTHGALGWCTVALLRGQGRVILVDTGGFPYRELLIEELRTRDLTPDDITDVLVTHAHWDHVSNAELFAGATTWMSRPELDWALSLEPSDPLVPVTLIEALERRGVLKTFASSQPLPDVTAVPTPGHTPGHTGFLVETDLGPVLFAGDAVKNEAELVSCLPRMTMDVAESIASMKLLRSLVTRSGALLACGHHHVLQELDGRYRALDPHRATIMVVGERPASDREVEIL